MKERNGLSSEVTAALLGCKELQEQQDSRQGRGERGGGTGDKETEQTWE